MYQFVKAVCRTRSVGSQWLDLDISGILVYDLYNSYSGIYLVLTNTFLTGEQYVDMETLRIEYSNFNGTLSELLVALGNRSLETVATLPNTTVKFAKYNDAFGAEYKIEPTRIGVVAGSNYPVTDMFDLELTRDKYKTDMKLIHSHCMVSVNGYYHMTDTDGTKAYVEQGATTMRKANNNNLGILSFLDVGRLTKTRIAAIDIRPQTETSTLLDKVYFTVDGDFTDRSFFLVLGGYLVFPEEGIFWRSGDNTFALDIARLPLVERFFESKLTLDLKGLGLSDMSISPDAIDLDEFWSDQTIRNLMTLSQSFFVTVDIPYMTVSKIHLRHSNSPGMFTAYQKPVYPLIVNYGRAAEYWRTEEDGQWSVTVQDSFLRNYILSQQPAADIKVITSHLNSTKPFYHSRGYLLEIAGYRHF